MQTVKLRSQSPDFETWCGRRDIRFKIKFRTEKNVVIETAGFVAAKNPQE